MDVKPEDGAPFTISTGRGRNALTEGSNPNTIRRHMSEIKKLLAEIEAFLARTGMRPSTFGHYVVRDGKFVDRLRKGGTVNLDTAAAVRTYIATGVSPLRERLDEDGERKGVSRRPKKVAA